MNAKVVRVIVTELELRGDGKSDRSPMRRVMQFWSLDGNLLAEVDPCSRVVRIEDEPRERK